MHPALKLFLNGPHTRVEDGDDKAALDIKIRDVESMMASLDLRFGLLGTILIPIALALYTVLLLVMSAVANDQSQSANQIALLSFCFDNADVSISLVLFFSIPLLSNNKAKKVNAVCAVLRNISEDLLRTVIDASFALDANNASVVNLAGSKFGFDIYHRYMVFVSISLVIYMVLGAIIPLRRRSLATSAVALKVGRERLTQRPGSAGDASPAV